MRRKDGKMDRRSNEYKDAVSRLAKARRAMKASKKRTPSSAGRRSDGRMDQRTRQGKEMAAKMAALRASRGKSKSFFAWLFS